VAGEEEGRRVMAKQSPTFSEFNPTGDARVARIKEWADALIEYVWAQSASFGPEGKRRAAVAVTNFEQGSMWAVKALFSEDAVKGDDGGSDQSP
jgi:hypothetical protein